MANPAKQRIVPYLAYADGPAAIEFLCGAFGFKERSRHETSDGRIGHAELAFGDNVVFLASAYPEIGLVSPRELPAQHAQIMCFVDDVDAHYARAHDAGATIVGEPEDGYGQRSYRALDAEGHRWIFASEIASNEGQG